MILILLNEGSVRHDTQSNACPAVVELLTKQRQPLPELNALYFLSPTEESVRILIEDFKNERKPQYQSAYVYFCSSIRTSIRAQLNSFIRSLPSNFATDNRAKLFIIQIYIDI